MKTRLVMAASIAAALTASADATNTVVAATLLADGSTNTWTQADLRDALGLMNRMYHRDMATDAGRRKWHGERIGEYLLPTGVTNAHGQAQMMMVHLYQDGFVATNAAVRYRRSVVPDPEAAAKAAAEAKRRADEARAAWESAHLPPDLAALRAAQRIAACSADASPSAAGSSAASISSILLLASSEFIWQYYSPTGCRWQADCTSKSQSQNSSGGKNIQRL